ncbi:phosphopantothenoylcysteine decarboxylase, partial [Vibrio sp. Vb2131]|uniref:phosphopantothenoylcysteine decarboxylase domain-containing protein n=1 Tax=Vibrio sp. Vb2131 TaxID=3074649 RepID=UPI0029656751
PVNLSTPMGVERINVSSAEEMYEAGMAQANSHDAVIRCAAVADYRPEAIASQKLKKTADNDQMTIKMVKNPDIVASVAALTDKRPFTVGFAAETNDVETYARGKLAKKNLNMICANDVSVEGQGFNSNDNAITLFWPDGELALALESKEALSFKILEKMRELM